MAAVYDDTSSAVNQINHIAVLRRITASRLAADALAGKFYGPAISLSRGLDRTYCGVRVTTVVPVDLDERLDIAALPERPDRFSRIIRKLGAALGRVSLVPAEFHGMAEAE